MHPPRRTTPDPLIMQVIDDLRRIVRVLRTSSRSAQQRLGVTGAQLFVLKVLSEVPSLSLNDLAARTHTHQSTVSVVVKRLVARGLVKRTESATDGRSVDLRLTGPGRSLLRRAPSAAQEELIEGVGRLSRLRRDALALSLRQLVVSMDLAGEPAPMFFEDEPRRRRDRA
jgi:DNA-binding MarR family transcriptional regulator